LLELELLLGPFVDGGFDQLPESGKSEYERLLDYDDLDAHEWLLGRAEPPMEVTGIVAEIRRFLELD
jgi:succinate dehydrogenase flavin-adding protein (antitoxin of CptAB toxin-antitoxin module)